MSSPLAIGEQARRAHGLPAAALRQNMTCIGVQPIPFQLDRNILLDDENLLADALELMLRFLPVYFAYLVILHFLRNPHPANDIILQPAMR